MNIAVIGLGAMGLPMASHLAKKFRVIGFDLDPARNELAEIQGVATTTDLSYATRRAQALIVAVRNYRQLQELLFAPNGVAEQLASGKIIILTSTIGVDPVEKVAAKLAAHQIGLVDAPISGGPIRAGQGELLITVGAYPEVWKQAKPILEHLASNLVYVGESPGKGQALKTVNQLLCGVHIAAAAEALALAGQLGIDQELALSALQTGAAESFMLKDRGPRALENEQGTNSEVKSRLDIFVKDMGIVTAAAKNVGMAVPLAAAAEQLYLLGLSQGLGASDDSSVIRVVSPRQIKPGQA